MPETSRVASQLGQRVITALIMVLIGLAALFLLPPAWFAVAAAIVFAGLGGWEAGRLAGLASSAGRTALAAALMLACLSLYLSGLALVLPWMVGLACLVWLVNFTGLARPATTGLPGRVNISARLGSLSLVLLGAWVCLVWLQSASPWLVIMLLVLIVSADTFAYFTGRAIGGPKLAPRISPGKTRSGAAGGLVGAMLLTALAAAVLPASPFTPVQAAALALVLAVISIGGDLFISLLKRQSGLKDSSNLLPGHGGVLDRFDSLSAALPFFTLAILLWGH